jgi:hypothetical protein
MRLYGERDRSAPIRFGAMFTNTIRDAAHGSIVLDRRICA